MGAYCSRRKPLRVIFQGLDAAGKTTLLYKLKLGEVVTTIPTIGFNVEEVNVKGLEIVCWDVGGRDKIRPLYRHYYPGTDGFVYVIDSNDEERLDDALHEMNDFLLNEKLTEKTVVMILANKQDLEGALPVEKIEEKVKDIISAQGPTCGGRSVFVQGCSATTGYGFEEAFSLFVEQIRSLKEEKIAPGFKTLDSLQDGGDEKNKGAPGDEKKGSQFHYLKQLLDVSFVKSLLFY